MLAGHWVGSVTDTASTEVLTATTLIDREGNAQLMIVPGMAILIPGGGSSPPPGPINTFGRVFVVHGDVCCGSEFSGQLQAQDLGSETHSSIQLNGRLSGGMFTGGFGYQGRQYSFSLAPSDGYARPLTMADLAGVYSTSPFSSNGVPSPLSLAINDDGAITGTHFNGCVVNGTVRIPDPAHNLFRMRVQFGNCGATMAMPRNGDYEGLGVLLRGAAIAGAPTELHDMLLHSLIGPVWLGSQGVIK
ncbi:hypothetical protein HNQ60_003573 [Povalibacter uvarum]|uniref:Uncharacterized protein n=1 Tax=Povalibacter uvarum TaxID=732238 RepID=A0A841HP89_9GAMM|nr:hypothetical protein [Povalibacter uvarum]MBB6094686.1 hypothetical protein [Povalibacter uvarum]